jgi:hypothetical protein
MGQASRKLFVEEFNFEKFAERMRAVFAEALGLRGTRDEA